MIQFVNNFSSTPIVPLESMDIGDFFYHAHHICQVAGSTTLQKECSTRMIIQYPININGEEKPRNLCLDSTLRVQPLLATIELEDFLDLTEIEDE